MSDQHIAAPVYPRVKFTHMPMGRVDELAGIALDALHGRELARLDAENERRLAE